MGENNYKNKSYYKRIKILVIALLNFVFCAVLVSTLTYAWFVKSNAIEDIKIDNNSLKMTASVNCYKFNYPWIDAGHTYIDYTKPQNGSVDKTESITSASEIKMNRYDPALLLIDSTMTPSKLLTNIVLEITCTVTCDCPFTLSLNTIKKNVAISEGSLAFSNYLDFVGMSATTLASQTIDSSITDTNAQVFYKAKTYAETDSTTKVHFYGATPIPDSILLIVIQPNITFYPKILRQMLHFI
jgi:hypothetical protein